MICMTQTPTAVYTWMLFFFFNSFRILRNFQKVWWKAKNYSLEAAYWKRSRYMSMTFPASCFIQVYDFYAIAWNRLEDTLDYEQSLFLTRSCAYSQWVVARVQGVDRRNVIAKSILASINLMISAEQLFHQRRLFVSQFWFGKLTKEGDYSILKFNICFVNHLFLHLVFIYNINSIVDLVWKIRH